MRVHHRLAQLLAAMGLELVHGVRGAAAESRRPPRCHGQEHGGPQAEQEVFRHAVVEGAVIVSCYKCLLVSTLSFGREKRKGSGSCRPWVVLLTGTRI